MDFWQVVVLSLVQGVTELFPLSSLGHQVIIPAVFHWTIQTTTPQFLAFVVLLHLGTATALLTFYWREWVSLIRAGIGSLVRGKISQPEERYVWLLFAGTVPAVLIALVLESPLRANFGNPRAAAVFLVVNAVIMFLGEQLRRRQVARSTSASVGFDGGAEFKGIEHLSYGGAVIVGIAQSLALLPGLSRSGSTIVAGLVLKLRHTDAAHFSFMLATPIILGAGVKTFPDLLDSHARGFLPMALMGGVIAGIAAYLSVRFLERYFQNNRLDPFAIYCAVVGVGSLLLLGGH